MAIFWHFASSGGMSLKRKWQRVTQIWCFTTNSIHSLHHRRDAPASGAKESKQELTHREWSGIGDHTQLLEKHPVYEDLGKGALTPKPQHHRDRSTPRRSFCTRRNSPNLDAVYNTPRAIFQLRSITGRLNCTACSCCQADDQWISPFLAGISQYGAVDFAKRIGRAGRSSACSLWL